MSTLNEISNLTPLDAQAIAHALVSVRAPFTMAPTGAGRWCVRCDEERLLGQAAEALGIDRRKGGANGPLCPECRVGIGRADVICDGVPWYRCTTCDHPFPSRYVPA